MELQKHKSDLMSLQRERQTWNMLHQSDQSQIRELEQTVLGLKRDVERLKRVASASATTTKAKINPMSNNVSENRENVAPGESKVSSDQKTQRLSPLKHTRSTVRRVPPPQEATKENTV